MRDFEASAGVPSPAQGRAPQAGDPAYEHRAVPPRSPAADPVETGGAAAAPETRDPGLADLFGERFRTRTTALWLTWFGVNFAYYGAFIWIPSLLYASGFSLVRSFEFTLIITLAQLPGYALAAVLIEVWGRRATLATFLAGSAVSAVMFGHAESETMLLVTGCAMSMFNLGAWGALYAVTPESYPTRVRATGAGWAAAFGRVASIIAPLVVPVLFGAGGLGLVFTVLGGAFLLAMVSALFLPEMTGEELE